MCSALKNKKRHHQNKNKPNFKKIKGKKIPDGSHRLGLFSSPPASIVFAHPLAAHPHCTLCRPVVVVCCLVVVVSFVVVVTVYIEPKNCI